ncbi:hypothetical protein DSM100685_1385 [Bifidobacterium avesanii]|nr:hypothetical protein DSM100685_1385 [Bifidobacterium avesanii]
MAGTLYANWPELLYTKPLATSFVVMTGCLMLSIAEAAITLVRRLAAGVRDGAGIRRAAATAGWLCVALGVEAVGHAVALWAMTGLTHVTVVAAAAGVLWAAVSGALCCRGVASAATAMR